MKRILFFALALTFVFTACTPKNGDAEGTRQDESATTGERSGYVTIAGQEFSIELTELAIVTENLTSEDIIPLRYMTNLTALNLWGNQIVDITPLSELTNLTELSLGRNQISDITPLSALTNLTWLDLTGNQISNIAALSGLTNLESVYLDENQITDWSSVDHVENVYGLPE
ncbi:MAG: leucine-rich repeat domain-containing protein [Defluviitaleaceae bacterium]|nr:leucine-rich repeat domain-containing protein [Defluviitaleaceae bacterium]